MSLPGPDTRIVELRVPGLVGTSSESLLDSASTVQIAGDEIGKVIRPSDRLHRPAPGPVLQAMGRSIPRTLEGYVWDAMTSGGFSKAVWAFLFPFSLANVSHWMLPPTRPGSRLSAVLTAGCRSVLRLAALLLTMLLAVQLTIISVDLIATQCLAPGASCLPIIPEKLRTIDELRTAIGFVPPIAIFLAVYGFSRREWSAKPDVDLANSRIRSGRDIATLRCAHLVVALSCLTLVPLGNPFVIPADLIDRIIWCGALGISGLALLTVVALPESLRARLIPRPLRGLTALIAIALVVTAAIRHMPLSTSLTGHGFTNSGMPAGVDGMVEVIGAALLAVCIIFAILLIPTLLLARSAWRQLPRRLRPWLGGWAAAPVLALAVLLGSGLGAGIAIAIRSILGAHYLQLPQSYISVTLVWGVGLALAIVVGLVGFAVAVPLRRRRRGTPPIVSLLQQGNHERDAAGAWARSAWERRHLHQLAALVIVIMSVGTGLLIFARFVLNGLPQWTDNFSVIGILALGFVVTGLVRIVYTAAKNPNRSRHLGALADLVNLWPRVSHPFIPPCYALKVVPELAARAEEHLAEPHNRVVLAGQNLGSLLATASAHKLALSLHSEKLDRLGLVTAGSPLQWGYQRAFPAIWPLTDLADLFDRLDGRWRGLARGTDILGGGVTTWRHQVIGAKLLGIGYHRDGKTGPLAAATTSNSGALVLGGDHWIADPLPRSTTTRRWTPGLLRHRDYVADPEWDGAIAMAAGLTAQQPHKPSFGEQPSLFTELTHPSFFRS